MERVQREKEWNIVFSDTSSSKTVCIFSNPIMNVLSMNNFFQSLISLCCSRHNLSTCYGSYYVNEVRNVIGQILLYQICTCDIKRNVDTQNSSLQLYFVSTLVKDISRPFLLLHCSQYTFYLKDKLIPIKISFSSQ